MFPSEPTALVIIRGSTGVYHVGYWRGQRREWECECDGFRSFGRNCKHIPIAQAAVGGRPSEKVIDTWLSLDLRSN
jgi:hypothetical protein